jgi:hypothetical protein
VQLVETEHTRNNTRDQAVATVSRGLKNLSVQLGCHVIALSQLMDDGLMRESGAIKNDASVVIKACGQRLAGSALHSLECSRRSLRTISRHLSSSLASRCGRVGGPGRPALLSYHRTCPPASIGSPY